jgi:hypothetical protein
MQETRMPIAVELWRDDKFVWSCPSEIAAVAELLNRQSASTDWAIKYEGWRYVPVYEAKGWVLIHAHDSLAPDRRSIEVHKGERVQLRTWEGVYATKEEAEAAAATVAAELGTKILVRPVYEGEERPRWDDLSQEEQEAMGGEWPVIRTWVADYWNTLAEKGLVELIHVFDDWLIQPTDLGRSIIPPDED